VRGSWKKSGGQSIKNIKKGSIRVFSKQARGEKGANPRKGEKRVPVKIKQ